MCSCLSSTDSLWRKRKRINSEEIVSNNDALPSAPKLGRHNNVAAPFYITLAKESPPRPTPSEDSDDSVYDSFHGRETGMMSVVHTQPPPY